MLLGNIITATKRACYNFIQRYYYLVLFYIKFYNNSLVKHPQGQIIIHRNKYKIKILVQTSRQATQPRKSLAMQRHGVQGTMDARREMRVHIRRKKQPLRRAVGLRPP